MREIRAIQTEYKGYLFRSRLEARWAVFFDACGVDWEYEPEGYDLGNGLYYLPDFLLHGVTVNHGHFEKNCDIYVEVKGQMNDIDAEKINRFYAAGYPESNGWGVSQTAVLVVGNIPAGDSMGEILDCLQTAAYRDHHNWPNFYNFGTVDGDYFGAYPGVDKHGVFNLFGIAEAHIDPDWLGEGVFIHGVSWEEGYENLVAPIILQIHDYAVFYNMFWRVGISEAEYEKCRSYAKEELACFKKRDGIYIHQLLSELSELETCFV